MYLYGNEKRREKSTRLFTALRENEKREIIAKYKGRR